MHLFDYLSKFNLNTPNEEFLNNYMQLELPIDRIQNIKNEIKTLNPRFGNSLLFRYSAKLPKLFQISKNRIIGGTLNMFNGQLVDIDTLQIICAPMRKLNSIYTSINTSNHLNNKRIFSNNYFLYEAVDGTTIYLTNINKYIIDSKDGLLNGEWLISTHNTINAGILQFLTKNNLYTIVDNLFKENKINVNMLDAHYTYTFIIQHSDWNPSHNDKPKLYYMCKARTSGDEIIYDYTYNKLFKNHLLKSITIRTKTHIGLKEVNNIENLVKYCTSLNHEKHGLYIISKENVLNATDYNILTKAAELVKKWIYTPMYNIKDMKLLAINMYLMAKETSDLEFIEKIIISFETYFKVINDVYNMIVNNIRNKEPVKINELDINDNSIKLIEALKADIIDIKNLHTNQVILSAIKYSPTFTKMFIDVVISYL